MATRTLLNIPRTARPGEVIEIRATIGHPMETGYRPGENGERLPRDIIRRFSCRYDGQTVFTAELYPAISANPYIAFHTVATQSGSIVLHWEGDNGFAHTETVPITVA